MYKWTRAVQTYVVQGSTVLYILYTHTICWGCRWKVGRIEGSGGYEECRDLLGWMMGEVPWVHLPLFVPFSAPKNPRWLFQSSVIWAWNLCWNALSLLSCLSSSARQKMENCGWFILCFSESGALVPSVFIGMQSVILHTIPVILLHAVVSTFTNV